MKKLVKFRCKILMVLAVYTLSSFQTTTSIFQKPADFGYESIIPEKTMDNLKMIGWMTKWGVDGRTETEKLYGKILRAKRFQNITRKVEKKYGLPKNLILAMVIQESGGVDLLPNGLDDGGAGLCHMQPLLADKFGLKTLDNCKEMRCTNHGEKIRKIIDDNKYDRKKLIQYDDRLHPLLNLDCVGRMLFHYKNLKRIGSLTNIQSAVRRYAGKYNYPHYWKNVVYYQKKLNDPSIVAAIEKEFNRINPNLLIGDEKGTYELYIKTHQDQNTNYGLQDYE